MPFTVRFRPAGPASPAGPATPAPPPPVVVDADEHAVEGTFHVFRRSTTVVGRPRTVVALRVPAADVLRVDPA